MSRHANQTTLAAMSRARCAWGEMPDWIERLALACDNESQSAIARRIQYSPATVSHVLKKNYPGDLAAVEAAVRKALMTDDGICPVLGMISGAECLQHQRADYEPQNPEKVRLYAACQRCPNKITGRN